MIMNGPPIFLTPCLVTGKRVYRTMGEPLEMMNHERDRSIEEA